MSQMIDDNGAFRVKDIANLLVDAIYDDPVPKLGPKWGTREDRVMGIQKKYSEISP